MTAMVSGDRAKAAGLTGIAGSLILAGAVVMMAVAAPATPHQQHASTASTASTATGSCHQLTSRSASASGRACLAGPSAVSARADAYTSESWSASRSARPPLARAAVS